MFDADDWCVADGPQLVHEGFRISIVFDAHRDVDVAREAHFGAHRNRQTTYESEAAPAGSEFEADRGNG